MHTAGPIIKESNSLPNYFLSTLLDGVTRFGASKSLCVIGLMLAVSLYSRHAVGQQPVPIAPYLDPHQPIEKRVSDLLSRMTLEEKVGQLEGVNGWTLYKRLRDKVDVSDEFKQIMSATEPGLLYGFERADPYTKVTLATGLSPVEAAEATNTLQRYAMAHSRLHIPLLLAEECPHGHMAIGATVFPTSIGQSSTWDPDLIQEMAASIAQETRAAGANLCYGPILDIAHEPRWSRVEETYGEDSFLTSQLGAAFVRGLQGDDLNRADTVAATLKHFAAYGEPEGGHNGGAAHVGSRELQSVLLPAFKAGIDAGASSIMTSYNAIDGIPSTSNHWLLTDLLRDQWKFQGFVTSDLFAIDGLYEGQHVAATIEKAAALAINAGVDSDLGAHAYPHLIEAVNKGDVSTHQLDQAVSRILRLKFKLGLFDKDYLLEQEPGKKAVFTEHKDLAKRVALESMVLLQNKDNVLPLRKDIDSIAVIGPNADSVYNQLGDYTAPQPDGKVTTVLRGIQRAVGAATVVRYARGSSIRGTAADGFAEALDAVRKSSVAVVVLGGSSARDFDTLFSATGAARPAMSANGSDMESGEGFDRSTLDLAGVQLKLLQEVVAIGKPVILVLIEGRPLDLTWPSMHVPAILNAWYPGEAGGSAIADVLFGNHNPGGRLSISVPRSVGQLPVYYGDKRNDYMDSSGAPLFPFGYGLSYSSFNYANLAAVVHASSEPSVNVTLNIQNTSSRAGDEVVQLYLHPLVSSVIVPAKALRGFQRIHLAAGETRTVRFKLKSDDLAIVNSTGHWMVEAGSFEIMVGSSSEDIRQTARFTIDQPVRLP